MNATELSEQLKGFISTGAWGDAARLLAEEWMAASEFGVYRCPLPEQSSAMVKFRTTGYPFKLRRQWEESKNDAEMMLLILPRVEAWEMRGASGEAFPAPQECLGNIDLLDDMEEAMLMWLTRSFWDFWRVRLLQAERKN